MILIKLRAKVNMRETQPPWWLVYWKGQPLLHISVMILLELRCIDLNYNIARRNPSGF